MLYVLGCMYFAHNSFLFDGEDPNFRESLYCIGIVGVVQELPQV
jgi:hypothetical protein